MKARYGVIALLLVCASAGAADTSKPVVVFILAGQSNMEGKARLELLDYQVKQPQNREIFGHLQKDEKWIERDDVWIKFLDRKGNLTVGYGSPKCIGPELEFGHVVGDHYQQQVLLIKTAWGGRSLYRDFRPPSAGLPPDEILEKTLAAQKKKNPAATIDDVKLPFGATYRDMLNEVRSTLADVKRHFPSYQNQGYELRGLIWFQGWNDMIDDTATAEYTTNLAHFIHDVRSDLKAPNLPFVIAQMGVGGTEGVDAKVRKFKAAQAAVMDLPEAKNNIALVKTDQFWDMEADAVFKKGWRENLKEWNTVGSDYPYHYLGSAKTYCRIGRALAEAVIALDTQNH
ncbi:MAG TPA: sialate O-acetylesterase [Tepidisphaeraceae bacterium]|nr:sialate O-acetylesterase [Tepidisphaeraceae bacterium]